MSVWLLPVKPLNPLLQRPSTLSIYPPDFMSGIYQSICLSVYLPHCKPLHPLASICLSVSLFVHLSVHLSICLFICEPLHPLLQALSCNCITLFVITEYLSVCLSVCQESIRPMSVCLFTYKPLHALLQAFARNCITLFVITEYLSVCLYVRHPSIYLFVCLSICLSVYL